MVAPADNDGMIAVPHQLAHDMMRVMNQRAGGFNDAQPVGPYLIEGPLRSAVRGNHDGSGGDFGDLVLDGPGEFQLPRPELRHAFVLRPLADIAPDFVEPVRGTTLAEMWRAHPEHDAPLHTVAL